MRCPGWSVLALVLCLGISNASAKAKQSTCSFYCFATPQRDERINMTLYRSIDCTHFVYGFAAVTLDNRLRHPTSFDLPSYTEQGNYRTFAKMKLDRPVKPLLGIRQKRPLTFIDDSFSRKAFSRMLVQTARKYHFEGLFLHFDGEHHYRNYRFVEFLKVLTQMVNEDAKANDRERLVLVLAIPASNVRRAHSSLADIHPHFDAIYLMADALSAADDPMVALHLQPLYPTNTVPNEDTISENAVQLVDSGVPSRKIVVGLSSWARSYLIQDTHHISHGSAAIDFGEPGDENHRRDGRLSYGELCDKIKNKATIVYDPKAVTLSTTDGEDRWYSFERSNHESFDRKIQWVSSHGYGGVGIMSIEGDDTTARCGVGLLPIHRTARKLFKCARGTQHAASHPCTRICVVTPKQDSSTPFAFGELLGSACSHIVISSANIQLGQATFNENAKRTLTDYYTWSVDAKPLLILDIGAQQNSAAWRVEIGNELSRFILTNSIQKLVREYNADGVQISWTSENMESGHDSRILSAMLTHLRAVLNKSTLIFLAVHPRSLYNNCYNGPVIKSNVDNVIVDGHHFHSAKNALTGHHGAMFSDSALLNDPRFTLEAVANEWVSRGMNRSKLILGVSAEGMKQTIEDVHPNSTVFGVATISSNKILQATDSLKVSQTQICELKKKRTTKAVFLDDLGVPVLVNGHEFVAYDDEQSARIKASWSSLNHFGGVAVYGIEMDNPSGECPHNTPFPILRTIAKSHICKQCPTANRIASSCNPLIKVACSYRVPDSNEKDPLRPQSIPFDKCSEIVVEEAALDGNTQLSYRDSRSTAHVKSLARLVSRLGKKGLIAAVRCDMPKRKFTEMLGQKTRLVDAMMKHVDTFGFTGIELKCDHLLDENNKPQFTSMIRQLSAQLTNATIRQCPRTVSIRIPAWQHQLHSSYDISMLNSLHHVVLEPFELRKNSQTTQLGSPLFAASDSDLSIASTINAWIAEGLERDSILLDIATYGVSQRLVFRSRNYLGAATHPDSISILSQKQMCQKNREAGYQLRTDYSTVASYATTPRGEWITLETQESIKYKMMYALREGLAGIGVMTLNEDDFANACSEGKFPLLSIVHSVQKSCVDDDDAEQSTTVEDNATTAHP